MTPLRFRHFDADFHFSRLPPPLLPHTLPPGAAVFVAAIIAFSITLFDAAEPYFADAFAAAILLRHVAFRHDARLLMLPLPAPFSPFHYCRCSFCRYFHFDVVSMPLCLFHFSLLRLPPLLMIIFSLAFSFFRRFFMIFADASMLRHGFRLLAFAIIAIISFSPILRFADIFAMIYDGAIFSLSRHYTLFRHADTPLPLFSLRR